MPSHSGSATAKPRDILGVISNAVIQALRSIDEMVEQRLGSQPNCRALLPIPRFSSVLLVDYVTKDKLGYDVHFTSYDYIPVLISELGIVRSIRFSGKTSNDFLKNSLLLEKLKRCKGEDAKIVEEVPGTFITFGKMESINLSHLQLYIGVLMGLIRPYAKILSKDSFAIIPSPLSLCAFRYLHGGSLEHVWLSPSTVTVHLTSNSTRVTKMNILGKWIRVVVAEGHMISCKTDPNLAQVSLRDVGPFPIVLPLCSDFLSDIQPLIESLNCKDLIACLAGIFVFKETPYMLDTRTSSHSGYFLALSELPIPLDIEIAALTGEPWKVDISGRWRERAIFPGIISEMELFEKTKKVLLNKIRKIRDHYGAIDLLMSQTIGSFLSTIDEFFYSNEYFMYCLSPPLITTVILDNIPAYKIYETILNVFLAIHRARLSGFDTDFELISLCGKDEILRKIIKLRTHTEVWSKAYRIHNELMKKFNLGLIV